MCLKRSFHFFFFFGFWLKFAHQRIKSLLLDISLYGRAIRGVKWPHSSSSSGHLPQKQPERRLCPWGACGNSMYGSRQKSLAPVIPWRAWNSFWNLCLAPRGLAPARSHSSQDSGIKVTRTYIPYTLVLVPYVSCNKPEVWRLKQPKFIVFTIL